jgi:photosystem II stability/assembly factor-like uncharacterized protein
MTRRQFAMAAGVVSAPVFLLCAAVALSLLSASAEAIADPPRPVPQQLPLRSWENYYGAVILPSGRGIVVGDKGIVMTSDDKGQTWTRQQLNKGTDFFNLYSVAFTPDGSQGWIVGDAGVIFHSSDSGATWNLQENKVPAALLKVAVLSPQNVCAVGEHGAVLCTSDGGNSWNLQKFEDLVFFDLAFADPQHGWAVGEFATVLNTVDGGKTWKVQTGGQRNISSDPYFAVAFTDPQNGLIFGLNGAYAVTTDGGKTWKPGNLPDGNKRSIYAAVTIPSGGGALYLGGADGALGSLQTGKMEAVEGATANSITGLALSPTYGLAVGMAGTILRTEDGGQHWSPVTTAAASLKQARAE